MRMERSDRTWHRGIDAKMPPAPPHNPHTIPTAYPIFQHTNMKQSQFLHKYNCYYELWPALHTLRTKSMLQCVDFLFGLFFPLERNRNLIAKNYKTHTLEYVRCVRSIV